MGLDGRIVAPVRGVVTAFGRLIGYRNPVTDADERLPGAITGAAANTVVLGGHSRIGANGPNLLVGPPFQFKAFMAGYINCINAVLGGRLRILANLSVGGESAAQVLTTQIPQLRAMTQRPQYFVMEIAVNDFASGLTAAQVIATYKAVVSALVEMGVGLIAFTDQGDNNRLNTQAKIQQQIFNRWLLNLPRLYGDGFVVIDAYTATGGTKADSTPGGILAAYTYDGTHGNNTACWAVAREALPAFRALFPPQPAQAKVAGPWANMIPNANCEGSNASGTNRWTASSGASGTGPDDTQVFCSGAGAATCTIVARSASSLAGAADQLHRPGNLLNIAFAATNAGDSCTIQPTQQFINCEWRSWTSSTLRYIGQRVRPTNPNGCDYAVTVEGSTAAGLDPTASWSTTIGATVTDGTVAYTVVPTIVPGDKVVLACELYAGPLTGSVGARISMEVLDAAQNVIGSVHGLFFDDTTGGAPSYMPPAQVLTTPEFTVPVGCGGFAPKLILVGKAGASVTVQRGLFTLCKVE